MKIHRYVLVTALSASAAFAQTNIFPSSGNVGIGTIAPNAKFEVYHGNYLFRISPYTADIELNGVGGGWARSYRVGNTSPATYNYAAFGVLGGTDGVAYAFMAVPSKTDNYEIGYDSASKLVLLPNGNVGIGTTNPETKLTVTTPTGTGIKSVTGGAGGWGGEFYNLDGGGNRYALLGGPIHSAIFMNGNVGIGTISPQAKLDIGDGSVRLSGNGSLSGFGGVEFANLAGFGLATASLKYDFRGASGTTSRLFITDTGNVGIGEVNPQHKLAVNGTIKAKEIIVETAGWSDYVFAEDYKLASLDEVEAHIKTNKHLPGIPSAAQVAEKGVNIGDMQAALLAKVEELTLHLIAQQKQMESQNLTLESLQRENRRLEQRLQQIESR